MNVATRIALAALGALLLLPVPPAAGSHERPRPSDVPHAETSIAPNGFQVYNDYASPERTYSSRRVVVHYVLLGIDAPPLNDDDANGVPDYVQRIGDAADFALDYYERRGFRVPRPDAAGPDARPDVYVSRFVPGTLGVAFPADRAAGGAFVVVGNNLDPSAERSFASVYATVAHELFHLVQFSYFRPDADPEIPTWILEGTAAALETRVYPDLDDLVSTIQLRRWFSATEQSMTTQSYGAQLLWRQLDIEQPRLLPALLTRLAAHVPAGEGQNAVAATYAGVAGKAVRGRLPPVRRLRRSGRRRRHPSRQRPRDAPPSPRSRCGTSASTLPRTGRSTLAVIVPGRATRRGGDARLPARERPARASRHAHGRSRRAISDGGRTLDVHRLRAEHARARSSSISNGGERAVPYAVIAR